MAFDWQDEWRKLQKTLVDSGQTAIANKLNDLVDVKKPPSEFKENIQSLKIWWAQRPGWQKGLMIGTPISLAFFIFRKKI
jgi:hypothetical protein